MKGRGKGNGATIIVVLAVMCVLAYMAISGRSNSVQANRNKLAEEVMTLDFEADYPQTPDGVLEKYCEIDTLLSGNTTDKFTKQDLEDVVEMQRMLLHPELLEINTYEEHVKGYADKIDYLNEAGTRIMQTNMETPRFSDDAQSCSIGLKQYWSGHLQVNIVYNLKREDTAGKWKIVGWYVNNGESTES